MTLTREGVRRILLDHNLAHDLAELLPGYYVATAFKMGWGRLANGLLLAAAEEAGFDCLLTADRSIRHQQNLKGRAIGVLVLSTNHWPTIEANVTRVRQALMGMRGGDYAEISLPHLRRPGSRRPVP